MTKHLFILLCSFFCTPIFAATTTVTKDVQVFVKDEVSCNLDTQSCSVTVEGDEISVPAVFSGVDVEIDVGEEEIDEGDIIVTPPVVENSEAPTYFFTAGTDARQNFIVDAATTRGHHGVRVFCTTSHLSYDDSIIYPGQPGVNHLHYFWGRSDADAYTSPDNITDKTESSCEGGTEYRAAVWIPAFFNSSTDEPVIAEQVIQYYKDFRPENEIAELQVIPDGMEFLASKETLNYKNQINPRLITKDGVLGWFVTLSFPSCAAVDFNGNPILSFRDMGGEAANIPNSHVAYPGGPNRNKAGCPSSHPYGFPMTEAVVFFAAQHIGQAKPYVSSDKMLGAQNLETLHADYIFGASDFVNQSILRCVKEARKCGFDWQSENKLAERYYSPGGDQLYEGRSKLKAGVDRTPFGKLPVMLETHQH